jgi:ERCC4-type nuclease
VSGTKTLFSHIQGENDDDQELTIIVDSREAKTAEKIVKGLREQNIGLRIEALEKGDYVLSSTCAVERKTVQDFVSTLTRRHLFKQLFKLKEAYPKALMLLEGYLPVIYKFSRIKPASVWGAMFHLAKNGIAMVNTTSYKETIDFLRVAAYQEQSVDRSTPTVHPVKKCETTSDAQIFFLASLPNIGKERAIAILEKYQTPSNAMRNLNEWPKDVYRLGPKTRAKVKKVFTTPFKK